MLFFRRQTTLLGFCIVHRFTTALPSYSAPRYAFISYNYPTVLIETQFKVKHLSDMVNLDAIFFNIGAFICAVFVLDYGADHFIDHTVIVAQRLGINATLISLLTAGAEWEELAVVIAAVAQGKPSLALGNVIGSGISNILGAFSLGLLFRPFSKFDRSARLYSLVQLAITIAVLISLATVGPVKMGKIGGGILVASFALYVLSIFFSIYRGIMKPPERECSDSEDDDSVEVAPQPTPQDPMMLLEASRAATLTATSRTEAAVIRDEGSCLTTSTKGRAHHLGYHIAQIVIGFLALSLSGYILAHSASSLSSLFGLSETVVGLTILAFATTLPEKLISLMSGSRGHSGILVATTAGSNIFLLTLCIGVVLLGMRGSHLTEKFKVGEIAFLCAASLIFATTVWFGTKRWVGIIMLAGYVAFLVLEFTVWRR